MSKKRILPPIHPGELLRDELEERGISLNRLARDIRVPLSRVSLIVSGKRGITADTALRLAKYFDTSAQMWLNLQNAYELEIASANAERIAREVIPADKSAA
jgi:addiction module HigA family antidote